MLAAAQLLLAAMWDACRRHSIWNSIGKVTVVGRPKAANSYIASYNNNNSNINNFNTTTTAV